VGVPHGIAEIRSSWPCCNEGQYGIGFGFFWDIFMVAAPRRVPHPKAPHRSFLALLVTFIGAATTIEYLFGLNLRIDQLLFTEPAGAVATYSPGRMAPTASTAFLAIGLALLLLDWKTRRGHRPAQVLSLWAALGPVATEAIAALAAGRDATFWSRGCAGCDSFL
jgi:hypothetical protein